MTTTSRGHLRLSPLLSVTAVSLALLLVRPSRAQNTNFSAECLDHTAELERNQRFTDARDNFDQNNRLCFPILEIYGGDVGCTNAFSDFSEECKNLDTRINDRRLKFCRIEVDGQVSNNRTFINGTTDYFWTFYMCLPDSCSNKDNIEAHVMDRIPDSIRVGSKDIVFNCTEFFDPVAEFWEEYMTWIIVVIVVLVVICFCGFLCLWWRRRENEKDRVHDPTVLYGPNMAYQTQHSPPQQAPSAEEYEEETTDSEEEEETSEEEELDTGDEELDEDDDELDTDGSSYHPHDDDTIEMSHTEHQHITTEDAMAQVGRV